MYMYGYVYVHGMDLYWNRPVAPPTWLRDAPNIYCQLTSVLITKLEYARLRMRQFDFLLAKEKNFLFAFDVDFDFDLVFNPYVIRIQSIGTLYLYFDFFSFFSSTPQVIVLKEYVTAWRMQHLCTGTRFQNDWNGHDILHILYRTPVLPTCLQPLRILWAEGDIIILAP